MTHIKASCPGCGEVELTADEILLRIGTTSQMNTYGFSCPRCADFIEKRADDRVVRLLLSGGVIPVPVHVPAEALEVHTGPAITHDELLEFHEVLERDDWYQELAGHSPS